MNRRERRRLLKEKKVSGTIHQVQTNHIEKKSSIQRIYETQHKKLIFIPFAILLISVIIIFMTLIQTGDFVSKGYSLKGGLSITVLADNVDVIVIQDKLDSALPNREIYVKELSKAGSVQGFMVESDAEDNGEAILNELEELSPGLKDSGNISVTTMGSSLGASFFKDAILALIFAFVFMSIVVFIIFKEPSPSLAVILCAFSDIVVTVAVINIFGIKLSTAGIAALLMLVGYSVDTDILLSTRLVKEKTGTVMSRVYSALKTGLTMNATTMITITIGIIFSQSAELNQIFVILFIGLLIDIINTWIQNVSILRMYLEKKAKKVKNE
jgi:preprotein translocase subunit SecF